jgi:hypothetical protein
VASRRRFGLRSGRNRLRYRVAIIVDVDDLSPPAAVSGRNGTCAAGWEASSASLSSGVAAQTPAEREWNYASNLTNRQWQPMHPE